MIISKYGIAFNNGKSFMKWEEYIDILKVFAEPRAVNDVIANINNVTDYSTMSFDHEQDPQVVNEIATALGIKPAKTSIGTKNRIIKYLQDNGNKAKQSILHRI